MSVKKTDPDLLRNDGAPKFVGNKESRFQPDETKRKSYFNVVKHMRFGPNLQNKFYQSFNTQVVPIQLPGTEPQVNPPAPIYGPFLLSQTGIVLTSELGVGLLYEASYLSTENQDVINTEGDDNIIFQ